MKCTIQNCLCRPSCYWHSFETPDFVALQPGECILAIENCNRKFGCSVPLVPMIAIASLPFGLKATIAALLVGLAIAIMAAVYWRHVTYVLTTRRIIERRGLLFAKVRETPLADIRDVAVIKSVDGGVIRIDAATGKSGGLEISVKRPDQFEELIARFRPRGSPGQTLTRRRTRMRFGSSL